MTDAKPPATSSQSTAAAGAHAPAPVKPAPPRQPITAMGERRLRLLIGVLSVLALLSVLPGLWATWSGHTLLQVGFDLLIIPAAIFGIVLAAGRFAAGPGLAAFCVGGAIALAAVLKDTPAITGLRFGQFSSTPIGGIDLVWLGLGRLLLGLLICLLGGLLVVLRRPRRSLPLLAAAAVLAAPAIVLVALWALPSVRSLSAGLPPALLAVLATATFIAVVALIAAATHKAIRAFEMGG